MGEVIHAFEKMDRIWVCGNCGCKNFELHENGTTECASCGKLGEPGHWHENAKVSDKPMVDNGALRQSIDRGSAELARASILRDAKLPDALVLIVIMRDGVVRAWGDVKIDPTQSDRDWIKHHCAVAASLLNGEAPPDRPED